MIDKCDKMKPFASTLGYDDKVMYGELVEFVQLESTISALIESRSDDDCDSVFSSTHPPLQGVGCPTTTRIDPTFLTTTSKPATAAPSDEHAPTKKKSKKKQKSSKKRTKSKSKNRRESSEGGPSKKKEKSVEKQQKRQMSRTDSQCSSIMGNLSDVSLEFDLEEDLKSIQ